MPGRQGRTPPRPLPRPRVLLVVEVRLRVEIVHRGGVQVVHQPREVRKIGVKIERERRVRAVLPSPLSRPQQKVDLAQDADAGELQTDHGGGGEERGGDEFGGIGAEGRVDEVDGAQAHAVLSRTCALATRGGRGKAAQDVPDAVVVREQFDLSRKIEQQIRRVGRGRAAPLLLLFDQLLDSFHDMIQTMVTRKIFLDTRTPKTDDARSLPPKIPIEKRQLTSVRCIPCNTTAPR
mmetsp:Transcript_24194/g.55039  ORF Transcript_24194/g.55039 Transcript_24194/m.55039 type:complete len:235 (+) Transcript_24194:1590-2294(+)